MGCSDQEMALTNDQSDLSRILFNYHAWYQILNLSDKRLSHLSRFLAYLESTFHFKAYSKHLKFYGRKMKVVGGLGFTQKLEPFVLLHLHHRMHFTC